MKIFEIEFLAPLYFMLILLVPVFLYFFYKKQKKSILFLFFEDLRKVFKRNNFWFYLKILVLIGIFIFYILLFANPNISNKSETISKNGIDIVIAFDISTSMEATDLEPSRIESAKKIISEFIEKQETNRVGLVVFAGKPFVSIPLTFDYNILKETIENISTNNINQAYNALAGTAVGDAIIMSETLFTSSQCLFGLGENCEKYYPEENREKVIILLTDGDANVGVDPKVASLDAKDKTIKIYTIGIGSENGGEMIYNEGTIFEQRVQILPLNLEALQEIAKTTSGEFFRATDNKALENVFEYLEKLEKSDIEIETKKTYSTNYENFVLILIGLLGIYLVLVMWKVER